MKAVYALETRLEGPVPTNALAERLGVTAGSVSGMLRRLDELGLLEHERYRGVTLTDEGRRVALRTLRNHRLLELLLVELLDVPWDRVHREAELLEHVLSDELAERIALSPTSRSARRSRSCASPTPIRRCCGSCRSAGSSRA